MSSNELLFQLDQLSQDFMGLAIDTAGATSGIAAECSQRLRELHDEFTRRFEKAEAQ